jgi:hypothetical protein
MADSAPLVEYYGNCHCGAFKFTFKAPEITQAKTCDCAICFKVLGVFHSLKEDADASRMDTSSGSSPTGTASLW